MVVKRKQYSLSFKLRVIRFYESNGQSLNKTSKEFIVDRKTIRSWIASKSAIKGTNLKTRRTKVLPRKSPVVYPEMENELAAWLKALRSRGACVDGKQIQRKALEILKGNETFQASRGWLLRFLKRHKLSLRRITTKGRSPPKNTKQTIQSFISDCASIHNIERSKIFNMDETSIYLDYPSELMCFLKNYSGDGFHGFTNFFKGITHTTLSVLKLFQLPQPVTKERECPLLFVQAQMVVF
jgi:transposase-like protein